MGFTVMATPQFNRKEVVRELLDKETITEYNWVSVLTSFAEKTDKEIYELHKKLKNEHQSRSINTDK